MFIVLKRRVTSLDLQRMKYIALLLLVALIITSLLVATPARAESFSIDMTDMMDVAAQIFNGLWKAFAVVIGITMGVAILNWIFKAIQSAF